MTGPVRGGVFCRPPNIAWTIDLNALRDRFHFRKAVLTNDFLAQGYASLSHLSQNFQPILSGRTDPGGYGGNRSRHRLGPCRLSALGGRALAIIGVTAGLLIFKQPFRFMALLGVMSLSGMLIKNAIVLIDQIDLEILEGKERFQAVVDSGVSRMMPVCMAALTTIMGMIPLLQDDFFMAMAVTIMFGLGFAKVLTLVLVPVLYATFFKIPYKRITTK